MKVLSWNCRGLGSPLTVHNLKGICKSHSPEIGFFCETKNQSSMVEKKIKGCGFSSMFCVEPQGRAGGLAFVWKENLQVTINSHGQYFIMISIVDEAKGKEWSIIGVHCHINK